MTYSDEEIDAACAKFFAVELAQDHESVKDSARNSMRAALSTLTTPAKEVLGILEKALEFVGNEAEQREFSGATMSDYVDEAQNLYAEIKGVLAKAQETASLPSSPNRAGETIPSSHGNARAAAPMTGEAPVGSAAHPWDELLDALIALVADVQEYERTNKLSPNPGKPDCWQSVTRARAAILVATPKAWTPIGWSGPFRTSLHAAYGWCIYDVDQKFVCSTFSSQAAIEIASALNTACQAGAVSEWRLIDDEAKSGKPVDLWLLTPDGIPSHGRRIAEVKWNTERSFNAGIGRVAQPDAWTYSHGGQVHLDGGTITHWTPLPPPPETGGR